MTNLFHRFATPQAAPDKVAEARQTLSTHERQEYVKFGAWLQELRDNKRREMATELVRTSGAQGAVERPAGEDQP